MNAHSMALIMLKPKSLLQDILMICLLMVLSLSANALDGIPDTLKVTGKNLVLNGAGIRTKFTFSVYSSGLYLEKKSRHANHIITNDRPMAIRMKITSNHATVKRVRKGFIEGFNKVPNNNAKTQISQFLAAGFSTKIVNGDVFDFIYTPANGTQLLKNNTQLAVIKGLPFKQVLFGIWLSNKPTQASLMNALLGKTL